MNTILWGLFFVVLVQAHSIVHANPPTIVTVVAEWCDHSCEKWDGWSRQLAEIYPQILFKTIDVEHARALQLNIVTHKYNNSIQDEYIEVPMSIWTNGQHQHTFIGSRTYNGLNVWIQNAMHNQFHPVFTTNNIMDLGKWDTRFNASITVISEQEPMFGAIIAEIPSLGFAWGRQTFSENPTIFIRNTHDEISMIFDYKWEHLMKKILPPIIPQQIAETDLGIETILFFAEHVVHIFTQNIPDWLHTFATEYPNIAFIHHETHLENKITMNIRSVQYTTNDLTERFETWFRNIWNGKTTPVYRKSRHINDKHNGIVDIQGDDLWEHAKNKTVLYTYGNNKEQACRNIVRKYKTPTTNITIARFNIRENDHELFPEEARSGFIFYFDNCTLQQIYNCEPSTNLEHIFQT